jgi:hypothetical protein
MKLFSGLICSLFLPPSPRHIVKHHITTQSVFIHPKQVMCVKDQLILDISYYFCNSFLILPLLQLIKLGKIV